MGSVVENSVETTMPIIDNMAAASAVQIPDFDPKRHLAYTPPSNIIKMTDIGYPEDAGVSPVAVSEPFQLFSEEAVNIMRAEIFNPEVMANNKYSSNIAAHQLRGYASKYGPNGTFTYQAWNHPETLAIISKVAGVELVPVMDFELGHINFSVKSAEQTKKELKAIENESDFLAKDKGASASSKEDNTPVVGWHTDSYPFVCVLMLSDCTNMVGGETALRKPDGSILKVRGPQMGCAAILQGRYITHQALRAFGSQERITSVTSFRPSNPLIRDDSVLNTVRGISDLSRLYGGFAEYRLEMLEARVREQLKQLRERKAAGQRFDTRGFKAFLTEHEKFLAHMNEEIVQDEDVIMGHIDEVEEMSPPSTVTQAPAPPEERLLAKL